MSEKSQSLNNVSLVGRAGADAELRYTTNNQTPVCKVTIAVDQYGQENPDWFELELWGKTAEIAGQYVKKGKQIGVVGSLKNQTWNDAETGKKRTKTIVKVSSLHLMGGKDDGQQKPDYSLDNW